MKWVCFFLALALAACGDSGSDPDGGDSDGDAGDGGDGGDGAARDPYPHACTYARDHQADGSYDWVVVYELDGEGRVLKETVDADGDADTDFVNTMTYDDEGRPIKRELDEGDDGTIELEVVTEYRDDGQIDRTVDYDGSGEKVGGLDYIYDDDGFLIEMHGDLPGVHAHGHPSVMRFENDENGCAIAIEQDAYHDGMIEEAVTRVVDDACRALEIATDQFGDGTVDWVRTQTFDDDGNLTGFRQVENDMLVFENETIWRDGLKLKEIDEHGTSRDVTRYYYDDAGHLIRIEDDPFDDGAGVSETRFERDGRGNVLFELIDSRGTGHPDGMSAYTYDCWE